ncbi:TatD DNase [Rhizopus azygosporus]|uniref:TatD DNase n=1 Tax=Rhizopus azygosporus TaxID=86630 RepID=A0A367JN42_RHIAZ|nr:TatD DNase [Rhizopus azygosporus]
MRFIDIGANLTDPMFRGIYRGKQAHADDFLQVIHRAKQAGVQKLFITGTNLSESKEAIEYIESNPKEEGFLYTTVGCHPTRSNEFEEHPGGPDDYYNKLAELTQHKSVIAIGECGLDYDRLFFCPKHVQKKYFERQFDLAEKTRLPMFLHNRNTGNDFFDLVKANRHRFTTGIVHSFTGSMEEMKKLVELDLYIGVNGCSLKTEENLQVVKEIPEDKLVIETDAPWCDIRPTHASFKHLQNVPKEEMALYSPPSKKKERFEMGYMVKSRNEPCTVGLVLHAVAAIRNANPNELSEKVWENTYKAFNLK